MISVIFALGTISPTFGWHDEGHKITGYIAWQLMTPQTREAVIKILRTAPEDSDLATFYPIFGIEPVETRNMEYFMFVPTWADLVRERSFPVRNRNYHHTNWHYDDTFWREVNGKPEVLPEMEEGGQALTQLAEAEKTMRDPKAKPVEKAIALAWFLHMAGDIHQPLHNSARVTDFAPKGDQGGNLFLLTPENTPPAKRLNLHTYWDGITSRSVPLKNGQCVRNYLVALGDRFIKKHPFQEFSSDLQIGQYRKWHENGLELAMTVVFSPDLKRFEMPSKKYQKKAFETAERQIALAGYRIGETLNNIFGAKAMPTAPN